MEDKNMRKWNGQVGGRIEREKNERDILTEPLWD